MLDGLGKEAKGLVEHLYREAARGNLINPESLFLRPDPNRRERVIALPAHVQGEPPVMGVKWISSFPKNLALGLPRASAVIVLNDVRTGFPLAVLEGARISAHRTALSAAVGAESLRGGDLSVDRMAVVGTGVISASTLQVLADLGWSCAELTVHDVDEERARGFADTAGRHLTASVSVAPTPREAVAGADLVLLATSATAPHVSDPKWFEPGSVVLHMSLRNLAPPAMAGAAHVVDEVSHALREQTSLALALAERTVDRADIRPVGDYLSGAAQRDGRTVVYAPFGLGSLDIALAGLVLDRASGMDGVVTVPGFAAS